MDLLSQGRLNGFCIISSDSDFTRLAARLRESEMYVLGMGEQKTPRSFISACNKFSYLDILYEAMSKSAAENIEPKETITEKGSIKIGVAKATGKKSKEKAAKAGSNMELIKVTLQQLTEELSDDDGWIYLSSLGNHLNKKYPDFDVRNFGYNKFSKFIESLDMFETKWTGTDLISKLKY